jgi:hypothetical protein
LGREGLKPLESARRALNLSKVREAIATDLKRLISRGRRLAFRVLATAAVYPSAEMAPKCGWTRS